MHEASASGLPLRCSGSRQWPQPGIEIQKRDVAFELVGDRRESKTQWTTGETHRWLEGFDFPFALPSRRQDARTAVANFPILTRARHDKAHQRWLAVFELGLKLIRLAGIPADGVLRALMMIAVFAAHCVRAEGLGYGLQRAVLPLLPDNGREERYRETVALLRDGLRFRGKTPRRIRQIAQIGVDGDS